MSWLTLVDDTVLKHTSETFGERVVYWPAEEPSFVIQGVFDASFQMVDAGGAMIQSTQPRLGVRLSQFAQEPCEGDRVEVRGSIYDVIEYQPDGQGGANLILHRCNSVA